MENQFGKGTWRVEDPWGMSHQYVFKPEFLILNRFHLLDLISFLSRSLTLAVINVNHYTGKKNHTFSIYNYCIFTFHKETTLD